MSGLELNTQPKEYLCSYVYVVDLPLLQTLQSHNRSVVLEPFDEQV